MLQLELHERSGPRERGEPQQCQRAGLRASRMLVHQMLCTENEQNWVQKQGSSSSIALAGWTSPCVNGPSLRVSH